MDYDVLIEKINNNAEDIKRNTNDIKKLKENDIEHNQSILVVNKDLEFLKYQMTTNGQAMTRIEDKVTKIAENRINDKYIEPFQNWNKVKWAIILTVATILVTNLIGFFMNLAKLK